jgi:glutamyl-tRNA reductase
VSVVVIGLNHRTVPLDLLERMTVPAGRLPKALADLSSRDNVSEAVVLSTCNRTEVYASVERFHAAYHDIRSFLSEQAYLPPETFGDHLYVHYDAEAASHLFTVASGLDSAVVGESEILGQVKASWEAARDEGVCGPTLNALFRHALETGKRARTETGISRNTTSVPQAAVAMATERLGSLAGLKVLVLGAGEMGERTVVALAGAGASEVVVANRTWSKAVALAKRVNGRAVHLDDVPDELTSVDLLLTSTGATSIVLEHGDLEPVIAARKRRPLLIVDMAVPRDVDPGVAELPGVTLLDMDDLRGFADAGRREREGEILGVRDIVDDELARYTATSTAREVAPLITTMRERAEAVRQAELGRQRSRLDELDPEARQAVEAITKATLAKLLHEPTVRLKDAAGTVRGERLAESLRDLFDL